MLREIFLIAVRTLNLTVGSLCEPRPLRLLLLRGTRMATAILRHRAQHNLAQHTRPVCKNRSEQIIQPIVRPAVLTCLKTNLLDRGRHSALNNVRIPDVKYLAAISTPRRALQHLLVQLPQERTAVVKILQREQVPSRPRPVRPALRRAERVKRPKEIPAPLATGTRTRTIPLMNVRLLEARIQRGPHRLRLLPLLGQLLCPLQGGLKRRLVTKVLNRLKTHLIQQLRVVRQIPQPLRTQSRTSNVQHITNKLSVERHRRFLQLGAISSWRLQLVRRLVEQPPNLIPLDGPKKL